MTNIRIDEAAQRLGIGSKKLYRELRQRRILGGKNIALTRYIDAGYFRVEQRSYNLKGTTIQRYYAVTLVTEPGMALLQEIADEMDEKNQVVQPERQGLPSEQVARAGSTDVHGVGAGEGSSNTVADARRYRRSGRGSGTVQ
ncbi:phage antirepressor KilAC domain-containing protein [uncultured Haliea sp.]|uniref:phage antirepressor KilAC domain-containing protein n=1 Tax=uncultured Haliea sp. TaxID=622616 RepID=UPI00269C8D4B|tara:strand:- start:5615 stop:6040 length:426 start_codon:yes stop_codon:yes gene_type:complete